MMRRFPVGLFLLGSALVCFVGCGGERSKPAPVAVGSSAPQENEASALATEAGIQSVATTAPEQRHTTDSQDNGVVADASTADPEPALLEKNAGDETNVKNSSDATAAASAPLTIIRRASNTNLDQRTSPYEIKPMSYADERMALSRSNQGADRFVIGRVTRPGEGDRFRTPAPDSAQSGSTTFELPEGFRPANRTRYASSGHPLRIICDKDNSTMVFCPAGEFTYGVDSGPEECGPKHQVLLSAFYIDEFEVTSGQYARFLAQQKDAGKSLPAPSRRAGSSNEPLCGISYFDAANYLRSVGKLLPTEAQWEYAARGAQGLSHPWGDGKPLWTSPRVPGQIDPVGSFLGDTSPLMVKDMAGNAMEWCRDWYSPTAYRDAIAGGAKALTDPTGPKTPLPEKLRVVRGGDDQWRVFTRVGVAANSRMERVGFRGVLDLNRPKPSSDDADPGKSKKGKAAARDGKPATAPPAGL